MHGEVEVGIVVVYCGEQAFHGDFLIVKRFTSKEEPRRLQCGIYLKKKYNKFKYISTQNNVNFIISKISIGGSRNAS